MGSELEGGEIDSIIRLPLFAKPRSQVVHYYSSSQESPLHSLASVPFRWEEEPGKPRKCTSSLSKKSLDFYKHKCLELPPRLLCMDANVTKLHSPTTVLDGPYINGKSKFKSSSFRIITRDWLYGSFRRNCDNLQTMVPKKGIKEKGSLGYQGKREVAAGDSCVFPSFVDGEAEGGSNGEVDNRKTKITRVGSFSALSHNSRTHFWATIYEGLKQVAPWRSCRKFK